ncbi:MAG: hypothetical protein Q8N47_00070, partial [Bryobacterales bacterium]|nr:hypothetical protein [Bryobacterales bacterium]
MQCVASSDRSLAVAARLRFLSRDRQGAVVRLLLRLVVSVTLAAAAASAPPQPAAIAIDYPE